MFILNIPTASLLLGQIALVFLFILAAFPKADFKQILVNASKYLAFIGLCYSFIAFLPLAESNKLLLIESFDEGFPGVISVNLIALIIINVLTFAVWGSGLGDYLLLLAMEKAPPPRPKEEKKEKEFVKAEQTQESVRKEVESLFDLYLRDYESGKDEKNPNLEHLENVLLGNMDLNIKGALCIDKSGKTLEDTIFHWDGPPKELLLDLFKKHGEISSKLDAGNLCQMIVGSQGHWYIIAKYRGSFLILKSAAEDPGTLLETTYKVFKSLS
jgi:hypothetical protein